MFVTLTSVRCPELQDSLLVSETFFAYGNEVVREYASSTEKLPFSEDKINAPLPRPEVDHAVRKIWRRFVSFTCGQNGAFAKIGPSQKPTLLAEEFCRLWPLGPPNGYSKWDRQPGCTIEDYKAALDGLFGATVPIPIASRWYGFVDVPNA